MIKNKNPKAEKRLIGTPAGENPVNGRLRHSTDCLTNDCEIPLPMESRKTIDIEGIDELQKGMEISTKAGFTGTHKATTINK